MKAIDLTNRKFGRLTALEFVGRSKFNQRLWKAACDCGKFVTVPSNALLSGNSKSCGCVAVERIAKLNRTHGKTGTPEHRSWNAMKARCYNPNVRSYKDYGARGIRVCKEWCESFEKFLEDMGQRPTPKHTLDRKDLNGDYTPQNCRWATISEQNNNNRANRRITYMGRTQNATQWARELGFNPLTIMGRARRGLPPELIFSREVLYAGKVAVSRKRRCPHAP